METVELTALIQTFSDKTDADLFQDTADMKSPAKSIDN